MKPPKNIVQETIEMISQKWLLSSILLILMHNLAFVAAQYECTVNDTILSNSLYQANINSLLPSLSANIDTSGFYNTSVGLSNTVYGSAFCRADVLPDDCRTCVQNASIGIEQSCPNGKQAIQWNEFCTLRYSNESMFGIMATAPEWYWWSTPNATSPVQFMVDVRTLMNDLQRRAPLGAIRKVAWGNISTVDFQTIFAILQCTPDLSQQDCGRCLIKAVGDIPDNCNGKIRCRVLMPSCILRYATQIFYNETRLQELLTVPTPRSIPPLPAASPPSPAISSPPPLPVTIPPPPGKKKSSGTVAIAVGIVGAFILILVCVVGVICIRKKKKKVTGVGVDKSGLLELKTIESPHEKEMSEPLHKMNTAESLQYDFGEIKDATDGFSDANKLGEGGFGAVYWGRLSNGQEIAVKRLSFDSNQGDVEFKNEVLLVAKLQHRNLVKLLGFSMHGKEKLLLYEFLDNLSLERFIFDRNKRAQLGWERRYNIIMGIAKGLLYLHEDSRVKIIHRDLKLSNILLDREMNPKIADFGTARLFTSDVTTNINTTRIVGTHGYMAPEYAMHGWFSFKSDVFSFGVLVLEIVSGQKNNSVGDGVHVNILSTAWRYWRQETIADLRDPILNADNLHDIQRCIHVALLCVQENADARPTMDNVVKMLGSSSISLPLPFVPSAIAPGGFESELTMIQEYNSAIQSSVDPSVHDLYPR